MAEAVSVARLTEQLRGLGVGPHTGVLLVHAALRAVGPVAGESAGVLAALRAALGPGGTLVVYTATPENSLTSRLHLTATAGLSAVERAAYLAAMPPFDPLTSPCSPTVGRLSEELRGTPGARRSAHPQTSFAALGPLAGQLVADHPYECHLGEESPVGRLYRAGASVLMLGAPLTTCTVFHLADYRVPSPPRKRYGCVVKGPRGNRAGRTSTAWTWTTCTSRGCWRTSGSRGRAADRWEAPGRSCCRWCRRWRQRTGGSQRS